MFSTGSTVNPYAIASILAQHRCRLSSRTGHCSTTPISLVLQQARLSLNFVIIDICFEKQVIF